MAKTKIDISKREIRFTHCGPVTPNGDKDLGQINGIKPLHDPMPISH